MKKDNLLVISQKVFMKLKLTLLFERWILCLGLITCPVLFIIFFYYRID